MGYSEICCDICGVSFHIGRIRRPDEPRSSAFDSYACPFVRESDDVDCSADSGCQVVSRVLAGRKCEWNEKRQLVPVAVDQDESNDLDDVDYVPEEPKDDESLEYDSEAVDSGDDVSVTSTGSAEDEGDDYIRDFWEKTYERYDEAMIPHSSNLLPWHQRDYESAEVQDIAWPRSYCAKYEKLGENYEGEEEGDQEPLFADLIAQKLEHIAGPGCVNRNGYNGYKISVDEMTGCRTLQCLVRKSVFEEYTEDLEVDDEQFEQDGEFFLSGLSEHVPDKLNIYETRWPRVSPARHEIRDPDAKNITHFDDFSQYTMVFHPWCLEIYKRAAQLSVRKIDIAGLTDWWSRNVDSYGTTRAFIRHPDVRVSLEQVWQHYPGMEYLAANPLFVPNLSSLLVSAISTDPDFDSRSSAFHINTYESFAERHDPFDVLSMELKLMILDYMDSTDIARLRLAARSFRQLPVRLWHRLIIQEMPWLWEAWSTLPYSYWATTTAAEIRGIEEKHELEKYTLWRYASLVEDEMPELIDQLEISRRQLDEAAQVELANLRHNCKVPLPVPNTLPRDRTNWYKVYCGITRHWEDLKGLQNRKRIWTDCEEIVEQIQQCRNADSSGW